MGGEVTVDGTCTVRTLYERHIVRLYLLQLRSTCVIAPSDKPTSILAHNRSHLDAMAATGPILGRTITSPLSIPHSPGQSLIDWKDAVQQLYLHRVETLIQLSFFSPPSCVRPCPLMKPRLYILNVSDTTHSLTACESIVGRVALHGFDEM